MAEKTLRLFDPKTGTTQDVPASQAPKYLMSGYTVKPGTKVDVQSSEGEGGTIDSSELTDALGSGFEIDSPELSAGRESKRKYGDNSIKAGALGAVRELTLGASDVIGVHSGAIGQEELAGFQEHNPAATIAGQVAGGVGGLLLSGGTSALAKGAAVGTKAVLSAGEIAANATRVMTKLGGKSFAAKLAQKAAPEIARGAAEGAVYQAGHLVSEQALGAPDMTAEQVMSELGTGAMFGGAAQGVFSAAAKAAPATLGMVKKLKGAAADKIGDTKGAAANYFGMTPSRLRKMTEQGKDPSSAVETMIKHGVGATDDSVKAWHTVDTKLGAEIGDTYRALDDAGVAAGKTLDDVYDPNIAKNEMTEIYNDLLRRKDVEQASKVKNIIEGMGINKTGVPTYLGTRSLANDGVFTQLKTLRNELYAKAKWDNLTPAAQQKSTVKAAKIAYNNLNDQIENSVAKGIADGSISGEAEILGSKLRELNKDFSSLKSVERDILNKEAKGSLGGMSMKDQVTAFGLIGFGREVGAAAQIAKTMASSDAANMLKFKFLKKMSQSQDKSAKKVTEGVNKLLNPIKGAKRVAVPATTSALLNLTFEPSKKNPAKESRTEAFKRVSEELAGLNSFDLIRGRLEESTEGMSRVAPHLAAAMQMKMGGAIEFLQAKLPRNPAAGRTTNADVRNWKPSKAELSKFERYAAAVNDPTSVLDQLSNGLVNRDGIEAIEAVYPQMFADMQTQVLQGLGEFQETMKYSERLNIGAAFNIPVDLASQPEYLMALQGNFQPAEQPSVQGQGANAPQTHDEAKIGQSDRATTPFQSTMS